MAQINKRDVCLLALQTVTTSGVGVDMVVPQGYTSAILTLNVLTVSGTTPTLNVYVQNKMLVADGNDTVGQDIGGTSTVYDDLISFQQATTSTTAFIARIVGGGNAVAANKNGTLTAGSAASGPIGGIWKIKYVVSGTSPSLAFSVSSQFIP